MAKFDIQELNYITSGKTQNTFNVSYCYTDDGMIKLNDPSKKPTELSIIRTHTFFGDIGEHDTLSEKYGDNKSSFYDMTQNIIVHNLYNINKTKIKTTAKNKLYEYHDIYVPYISTDFINICQHKSNAYGLTYEYDKNPTTLSLLYNNTNAFDVTYHAVLSADQIHTFLYPKPDDILTQCSTYTDVIDNSLDLSNAIISTIFSTKRDLLGITHNYIVELPESKTFIDYTKGYVLGDTIVAKNHLNYAYSMSTDSLFNLSGCREYCNIDSCGNQLYMTYRDNIDYESNYSGTVSYYSNDGDNYNKDIDVLTMTKKRRPYNYQHVEVIESWNRFDGGINAGHKSSMFSIKLIDTGLNESTISEDVKAKLRQNVKNSIRSIIENIIPAHTQLFEIYFDGK